MVPSGTCTAPSSVGLTAGSRRSASCGRRRGLYASLLTGVDKGLLPCQVIFRQGDKQPIGRFNTVAGDAAQNAVLTDAFAGGFVVGHRVAGAAVQQSMIPAGRPGGDIMALNEQRS